MMDGSSAFEMNGSIASEAPQTRVPDLERIRNARNKRKLQLKDWHQYDRKMMREAEKLQRKGLSPPSERGFHRAGHSVKFPPSLIFLEAAARGDLDEVRKLLSNGVCPDVANEDGLTALHQQAYRFTAEESAELKKTHCCIDNTPEMCRLLLRFGANPNARDSEGWTPLHAAATCLHTDLCAILIANGADLLAMNTDGNMPYECCVAGPTLNLIETEMDRRGITQEELDDLHRLPECKMLADMEEMYKAGADFNQLDQQGAAMLHIAAACGYEEVTIFLLKHGAKIDLTDRDGWQAIHIAACWDHLEIIEVLVNFGADIMAETTSGETVFDICEDLEIHSRLIELKQEMERKQTQQLDSLSRTERPRELVRRRSSTNPRSASIRRTSMREKKMISWKEAKQEAEMRGITPINLGEGETPESDAEQVKQRQQQEPIQLPVDVNFERRVTSPLTVSISNDKSKPDVTSSVIRSPSPSGQPSSTACVSSPQTKRVTALTSPPLLSGPGRLSNGVTSPVSGRPPSRLQDRNSTESSCTASNTELMSGKSNGPGDPDIRSQRIEENCEYPSSSEERTLRTEANSDNSLDSTDVSNSSEITCETTTVIEKSPVPVPRRPVTRKRIGRGIANSSYGSFEKTEKNSNQEIPPTPANPRPKHYTTSCSSSCTEDPDVDPDPCPVAMPRKPSTRKRATGSMRRKDEHRSPPQPTEGTTNSQVEKRTPNQPKMRDRRIHSVAGRLMPTKSPNQSLPVGSLKRSKSVDSSTRRSSRPKPGNPESTLAVCANVDANSDYQRPLHEQRQNPVARLRLQGRFIPSSGNSNFYTNTKQPTLHTARRMVSRKPREHIDHTRKSAEKRSYCCCS
ncbi:protein phosphatase 1 regulatory inhibitor subunit 16B [Clonorchis sinensis]|uniref:Protein phosphatase 1 regulatory inhibitor subunit 16B n=1 Tax=Clonorchis sinensis TaxID=79923 RepID=G7YDC2_CLOSI|nr:protein phosphatase 1 regulatory inhibitor subunit 16B [Clonorchis sinensis]